MIDPDLRCYGDHAVALSALVPALDLRSPIATLQWYGRAWDEIAEALGFAQELVAARASLRLGEDAVAGLRRAGVLAFDGALAAATRPDMALSDAHARAMQATLRALLIRQDARTELWQVRADASDLPEGACYDAGDGRPRRVFYPDAAPGLFGDGVDGPRPQGESACGWQTPVSLYLGTFPWVYSTRLGGEGPGMRWTSGAVRPATLAFAAMASLIEPEGNLRQDARQVATIARHFLAHTAPLLRRLPTFVAGQRGSAGRLFVRKRRLYVHQGSLHVAELLGPRGPLRASAYNYVLQRFATFFAVRRAALSAFDALPSAAQEAARRNPDPCLRTHLEELRRAG